MPTDPNHLEAGLIQFRLDILKALAEIDVEISALQQAVTKDRPVTSQQLKKLRDESRKKLHKFFDYHAQHVALAHQPPRE